MPVSTTWVNPSAGGALDLATGAILSETWTDGVASDLLRLGGTTGQVTQTAYGTFSGAISTASGSFVTTSDLISMTTTGGDVLFFVVMTMNNATGGNNSLGVQIDATGYIEVSMSTSPAASAHFSLAGVVRYNTLGAGAHTFNTGWRSLSGGTLNRGGAASFLLAAELKR